MLQGEAEGEASQMLKFAQTLSPTSLQGTPGLLCTRNGEAQTLRKILVKEDQPQEVDRD